LFSQERKNAQTLLGIFQVIRQALLELAKIFRRGDILNLKLFYGCLKNLKLFPLGSKV